MTFSLQAQEKIRVACIGDSITEGAGLADSLTYPRQLQTLLGDRYEVKNFGVGGRTLLKHGDFPYWQEAKYREALAWKPDVVIIKLGTNDSKPQNWIYSGEFEKNYRDFVKSFSPVSANIFVCTPIPVFREAWGITETIVQDEIVPTVKEIAATEKLNLIDLNAAMNDKGELVPDGVHPDEGGAAVIARTVFEALNQYELAGH